MTRREARAARLDHMSTHEHEKPREDEDDPRDTEAEFSDDRDEITAGELVEYQAGRSRRDWLSLV